MAYDSKAIQDLKQQLEALMNQAALTSRFFDVISAATALEALKAWQLDGGMGDLPAAVREVRGINLPAAVETSPAASSNGAPAQGQRANSEAAPSLDPHPTMMNVPRNPPAAEPVQDALEQLNAIRRRLSEIRYDLGQINKARWVVERLRYDRLLIDAGRLEEVEELMEKLNEMREDAQRKSDGGASSELSGDYERAFTVFRQALRDGYQVIADDRTGEVIEVEPSLLRVREKYFQQQIKRTEERFNEAKAALADGNPEVAVSRLSEALAILQPVESPDGINWRTEVNKLLDQAKQEQEAK